MPDTTPQEQLDQLLTRKPGERNKHFVARLDFFRLGAGRSITKLLNHYLQNATELTFAPPSLSIETLYLWSSKQKWIEQSILYDSLVQKVKNQEIARHREEIIARGFALDYKRIAALDSIATLLEDSIKERDEEGNLYRLWTKDIKSVRISEDEYKYIEQERLNAPLVREFRATLGDIAKEVEARPLRIAQETTTKEKQTLLVVKGVSFDDI